MKEIKIEHITYTTEYEAIDGTRFSNKKECINYDNSAKAVLREKINNFTIRQFTENDLYGVGSEEYRYILVKPTCELDRNYILQYYNLLYPSGTYDDNRKKLNADINEPILIFGIGYSFDNDYSFYYYGTPNQIINGIKDMLTI